VEHDVGVLSELLAEALLDVGGVAVGLAEGDLARHA